MKKILLSVAFLSIILASGKSQQRFIDPNNQQLSINQLATNVDEYGQRFIRHDSGISDMNSASRQLRSEPWQDNLKEYNPFFTNAKEWPIPEINFYPSANPQPAGDLNNDGFDDFVTYNGICADERTANLDDKCYKSLIFYGNNKGGFGKQLEYRKITPVGDINGDGFGDAFIKEYDKECYLYTGSKDGFVLLNSSKTYDIWSIGYINIDVNKDGFNDCIYAGYNSKINIIYGNRNNQNISSIYIDQTVLEQYSCLSIGGSYILFYYPNGSSLNTYQFDTNTYTTYSNIANLNYHNSTAFDYTDIDNDGKGDLISYSRLSEISIYNDYKINSDLRTLVRTETNICGILIGDINSNEIPEFIIYNENKKQISNIKLNNGVEVYNSINLDFPIHFNTSRYYPNIKCTIYDYNNDGKKELLIRSNSDIKDIYKTIRIDNQSIVSENTIEFDFESGKGSFTNRTCNLGDINGNGLDDIALYNRNYLEIYTNGNIKTPALLIDKESDNLYINKVVAADLNNDGFSDWIVGYKGYPNFENSRIDIYYGGSNIPTTPTKQINIVNSLDITLDINAPKPEFGFNIIGSVDGDNYPELIMFNTSDRDKNKIFVYKGAEIFPDKPATSIDFASNFGDSNINSESEYGYIGSSAVSLDDINNDGINDFVIADCFRNGVDYNIRIQGCLFVFYGNTNLQFTTPAKLLYNRTFDSNTNTYNRNSDYGNYLVSGDYNGDGIKDIAVSGTIFQDNNYNAVPGVDIYYGGNNISNIPNKRLYVKAKNNSTGEYSNLTGHNGLTTVPDIDGDKADELIISLNEDNYSVGYLYLGSEGVKKNPVAVINDATPLGGVIAMENYYYSRFPLSIAKFTNKNVTELISIRRDINYCGNTLALYRVTDPANTAPKNLTLSNDVVAEDAPVGTEVGVFSATDVDVNDVLTYTIADNENFKIEGDKLVTKSTFDYETKSEYKVVATVTDAKGDIDQKEFIITITEVKTTAIDKAVNANVKLYPNPAVTTITIETSVLISRVDIVNIIGNVVYSQTVNATNTTIDISNLQSGIYNIKGYALEGVITRKFVKR